MKWLKEYSEKNRLKNAFYCGEIGVKYNKNFVIPFIQNCQVKKDRTVFTFIVPTGLNPDDLEKHSYVFRQTFGENIELEGESKRFILTVHNRSIPSEVPYSFERIMEHRNNAVIPVISGIDVNGRTVVYDMKERPHLCLAGETGSGKSTLLRAIVSTLIQCMDPSELRLYLGDMKRSEFHLFRNVKHVEKVCTDPEDLHRVLKKVKAEMKHRGDLLDAAELSDLSELEEKPPCILVCIDEVALLKGEKDLMEIVEEISSIGRALEVFLILSMQRPDADVLDGKLKNNLTVRMGFRCADAINSKIIGTPGSERLGIQQKGRMIMKMEKLTEIQAPYLSVEGAKSILKRYKSRTVENGSEGLKTADMIDSIEKEENVFGVME